MVLSEIPMLSNYWYFCLPWATWHSPVDFCQCVADQAVTAKLVPALSSPHQGWGLVCGGFMGSPLVPLEARCWVICQTEGHCALSFHPRLVQAPRTLGQHRFSEQVKQTKMTLVLMTFKKSVWELCPLLCVRVEGKVVNLQLWGPEISIFMIIIDSFHRTRDWT